MGPRELTARIWNVHETDSPVAQSDFGWGAHSQSICPTKSLCSDGVATWYLQHNCKALWQSVCFAPNICMQLILYQWKLTFCYQFYILGPESVKLTFSVKPRFSTLLVAPGMHVSVFSWSFLGMPRPRIFSKFHWMIWTKSFRWMRHSFHNFSDPELSYRFRPSVIRSGHLSYPVVTYLQFKFELPTRKKQKVIAI